MKLIRINAAIIRTALTTMAFQVNDLKGFLFLVLFTIPSTASTNIDCNGKSFHCLNSYQFMICVDLGGGITSTIDDFVISCPPTTVCHESNRYECEFPKVEGTTPSLPITSVATEKDIQVLAPLMDNVTTTLPVDITTELSLKYKQTEAVLIPLETSTSINTDVSNTLKKEVTAKKATVFESNNTTPINIVSDNRDNIIASNFSTIDFIPANDKKYIIESTIKTSATLFTTEVPTSHDKITESTILNDNFTESNSNFNTVTENLNNQFTTQINGFETNVFPTQTTTSNINSDIIGNLDGSDNTMINKTKPTTVSPNIFAVTDIITDTTKSEKSTQQRVESLENLMPEFSNNKEMLFESNNSTPINIVSDNTENIIASNFSTIDFVPANDKKYIIESTTKITTTLFTMEVPTSHDKITESKILIDNFTKSNSNLNTVTEKFNNQFTTQTNGFGSNVFPTQTTTSYINSDIIDNLDGSDNTIINNKKPTTVSPNIFVVTDIITDTTKSAKSTQQRVETLQKSKLALSNNKEMQFESNKTTTINTASYNADDTITTNFETKNSIPATDKKYSIETATKIFTTLFTTKVPTNHDKTIESTTQTNQFEKKVFPTQNVTLYVNSDKTANLNRSDSTVLHQTKPLTASSDSFMVTDIIINETFTKKNTSKILETLQELKEKYTDNKEMVFVSNNTIPINTASYKADNVVTPNFNANKVTPTTDRTYSIESTTLFTMIKSTNQDKVMNSTILVDSFTESNANVNTVDENSNNQSTRQINELGKVFPAQTATMYVNSDKTTDLDRRYSIMVNQTTPTTLSSNNLIVTNTITDAIASEKNTPQSETLQKLKEIFTDNEKIEFKSNNTTPINTASNTITTNFNIKDSISATDKKYTIESTTKTSTRLFTTEVPTVHDKIIDSTISVDTFTPSNSIVNTVKENFATQFTTQTKKTGKEATRTATTYVNSNKTADSHKPENTIVNQTKTTSADIFIVTDIITDTTMLGKHNSKKLEQLQKLKEKFSGNKVMFLESNNTTPINTGSFKSENVVTTKFNAHNVISTTEKVNNFEPTTKTSTTLFTMKVPTDHDKVMVSTISVDIFTESNANVNTVEENLNNQFTTAINEFRKEVSPTQTAPLYVNSDRFDNIMVNQTTPITASPSPNTYVVTDIITDTIVSKINTPKRIKTLQKVRDEFSDKKETILEYNNTTPINTAGYKAANIVTTKFNANTPTIDKIYSIESTTKTSDTISTMNMPRDHDKIMNSTILVDTFNESNAIINTVDENVNNQFTTQITEFRKRDSPAQTASLYLNSNKTADLDRHNSVMVKKTTAITPSPNNVVTTDIITDTTVSEIGTPKMIQTLQKVKEEFLDGNKMVFQSNNTIPIDTVSYNTDNATNINRNDSTHNTDKIYSIESSTKLSTTLFAILVPSIVTETTVPKKHISKKIETLQLKDDFTFHKDIVLKSTDVNSSIKTVRYTTEDLLATNDNTKKINPDNVKINSAESTSTTYPPKIIDSTILSDTYFESNLNVNRDKNNANNQFITSANEFVKRFFPRDTTIPYLNVDKTDEPLDSTTDNQEKKSFINPILVQNAPTIRYTAEKSVTNIRNFTTKNPIRNMTFSEPRTLEVTEPTLLLKSTVVEGLLTTPIRLVIGESIKPAPNVSRVREVSVLNLTEATENTLLSKNTTEEGTTMESIKPAATETPLAEIYSPPFVKATPQSILATVGLKSNKGYNENSSRPEYRLQNTNSNLLVNSKIDKENLTSTSVSPLKLNHLMTTKGSITNVEASVSINNFTSRRVTSLPLIYGSEKKYSATPVSPLKNIEIKTIYNDNKSRMSTSKRAATEQKAEITKQFLHTKSVVGENDVGDFETLVTPQFDSLVILGNSENVMGSTTPNTLIRSVTEPTYMVEMIDTKSMKTKKEPIVSDMIFNGKHIAVAQNNSQNKINKQIPNFTLNSKILGNFSNQGDILNLEENANIREQPEIYDGIRASKNQNEEDQSTEQKHLHSTYYEIPSLIEVISPNTLVNNYNKRDTGYDSTLRKDAHVVQMHMPRTILTSANLNSRIKVNNSTYVLHKVASSDAQGINNTKEKMNKTHNNLIKQLNLTFNNMSYHHPIASTDSTVVNISYKQTNQMVNKLPSAIPSTKEPNKSTVDNSKPAFDCRNHTRGKYADSKDCRKFYICIGNLQQIVGTCPNNTVFSEINKQCTRNLSHCVRNNQFHCLCEGRFIDFFNDNIYFICVKNKLHFIRYKLQCQSGYHINKVSVKCEKDVETSQSASLSENFKINIDRTASSRKSRESEILAIKNDFECTKEGKFPYSKDCTKYYVCSKNKRGEYRRKIKKCSKDEVYDKDKKKCKITDSVEC